MRNFLQLAANLPVIQLLHAIQRQPELWNENKLRQEFPNSPHAQVDDIWLRFNKIGENVADVMDEHESINYPAWFKLPQAHAVIYDLMRLVEAQRLGRVIITRLAPGKEITPHIDSGAHAEYYERAHLTLQNAPGSNFYCGMEQVCMRPGDIWWFQNVVEHWVKNNSAEDRITMIIDYRCAR